MTAVVGLRPEDVDVLRGLSSDGRNVDLDADALRNATLGAVLELACTIRSWADKAHPELIAVGARWSRSDERLAAARAALEDRIPAAVPDYAAPRIEIQPTPLSDDGSDIGLFCERFKRSLTTNAGFSPMIAAALAGVLGEMVDNVICHSGESQRSPSAGVMGYTVISPRMEFAVCDVGRGTLASLRTNPAWVCLHSAEAALKAAVLHDASSRLSGERGTGFRKAFQALADLGGTLHFRSDDAAIRIEGQDIAQRIGIWRASPQLGGVQLSIACGSRSCI